MAKIPAAQARLFKNVFVCKRCAIKVRASPTKIMGGKVKCHRCLGKAFRPIKRK